jgi:hypothetical protein
VRSTTELEQRDPAGYNYEIRPDSAGVVLVIRGRSTRRQLSAF